MTPIPLKVLVIDDGNYARKEAMINACRGIFEIYRLDCLNQQVESDQEEEGYFEVVEEPITSFDIILVHGQELDLLNGFAAAFIIGYGGYEGYDPRLEGFTYQIYRAITSSNQALSQEEATELKAFYNNNMEGDAPAFFFSSKYDPLLEKRLDTIHNHLFFPNDVNWDSADDNFKANFTDSIEAWNSFLYKVKNILDNKASIESNDSDYQLALEELIEKTINNGT